MANNMTREVYRLIKDLESDGWRIEHGKRHYKVFPPGKPGFVTISVSPSDVRAMKNIKSDIRRLQHV